MNPQVEAIYDWMIKYGRKMCYRKASIRGEIVYNASRIAQIHAELSSKRGAISKFSEYLVQQEVFTNKSAAQQALRLYATNIGNVNTEPKRKRIIELYDDWKNFYVKRSEKDIEKWNKKLQEYWSTK